MSCENGPGTRHEILYITEGYYSFRLRLTPIKMHKNDRQILTERSQSLKTLEQ